ncbi:hypothetical protein M422DRAFT_28878 [Sphaerobolus stellatus SS14]|nr:hypothetical protein M422DRAFT_28878 [Sphaerobolus stellatus SS14]
MDREFHLGKDQSQSIDDGGKTTPILTILQRIDAPYWFRKIVDQGSNFRIDTQFNGPIETGCHGGVKERGTKLVWKVNFALRTWHLGRCRVRGSGNNLRHSEAVICISLENRDTIGHNASYATVTPSSIIKCTWEKERINPLTTVPKRTVY